MPKKMISAGLVIGFLVGLIFGLSITLTVRNIDGYSDASVQATVAHELVVNYVPTATPHVCPAIPPPCPTVLYKPLPDVKHTLSSLSLADYEFELVDSKLESYIQATEGEYDWNLIAILSLHRSAHNYMLEAVDDVIGWFNLGELTCEG